MKKLTDLHPAILSALVSAIVVIGSVAYLGGGLNSDVENLKIDVERLIEYNASLDKDMNKVIAALNHLLGASDLPRIAGRSEDTVRTEIAESVENSSPGIPDLEEDQ